MKSYCLKCRKYSKNIKSFKIKEFQIQVTVEKRYYENVQYVIVKNLDLLKIKKEKDY